MTYPSSRDRADQDRMAETARWVNTPWFFARTRHNVAAENRELPDHDVTVKNQLFIISLLAAALAMGCKPSTTETTKQQLDKAQAATKVAAQQMQDYAFAQKTEFVAKMRTQLAELNRSLDELSAAIEKSSAKVKAETTPKLAVLREQATQLTKQLEKVANATPSTWSSIKAESEKAYAALKDGLAQSRQWISDKIAP